MARAKANLNNNSNSNGLTWLWVILCVILLVVILFAIFYPRRRYRMSLDRGVMLQQYPMMQMENMENMSDMMEPSSDDMDVQSIMNSDKPMMIFFYAPWCGHCTRAKPEFQKLMQKAKGRAFMINCDEHQDIAKAHDIQGFPTIRYYRNGPVNGNPQEYMGPRTFEGMWEFMN